MRSKKNNKRIKEDQRGSGDQKVKGSSSKKIKIRRSKDRQKSEDQIR
mgnify:CR=1 FL=1